MADVKYRIIHKDATEWINFASSMECDLITIDGIYIRIADVYKFRYDVDTDRLIVYENDSDMQQLNIYYDTSEVDVTITCTSDFVWFTIRNRLGNQRTCCFFYEILGGMVLYNWKFDASGTNSISLSQFSEFIDKNTGFTYSHTPVLQLTAESEQISLSNELITKDGYKLVTDPNFISCTTVEVGKVITFDNHDYYSVGEHTLVPIWEDAE